MKILFASIPNVHYRDGQIFTGPNSGARWSWSAPGNSFHGYAPYPFDLAQPVAFLRSLGHQADLYDGVAMRHWNLDDTRKFILDYRPSIIVIDISTPVYNVCIEIAEWVKRTIESIVVLSGPHMAAFGKECKKLPFVDHCVIGELEKPIWDIVERYPGGKGVYEYEYVDNVNELPDGSNFAPYRDVTTLGRYYDPSMDTARTQLQVRTSRSCPFKCTYCLEPKTVHGGKYRARSASAIIDEIKTVIKDAGHIGSIFFDDDTFNLGDKRIKQICAGLKDIGLPWTMMGRIDTSALETYDAMVDAGCVGMRFGIESFNQQLLDNTKKNLDAKVTYSNIKYLLTRFRNMEFHFTTLANMPGSKPGDRENDQKILAELIAFGAQNGHRVHYQSSEVVPFPGTELWEELVEMGHGERLKDFKMYDGHPDHNTSLIKTIGLLGGNYAPKASKYSDRTGTPTDKPSE